MTIAELLATENGQPFTGLRALVVNATSDLTKSQKTYWKLELSDNTGRIESPWWNPLPTGVATGIAVSVAGVREEFNGKPQIKFKSMTPLADGTYTLGEFVPAYTITDDDILYFVDAVDRLSEPWKAIAAHAFGAFTRYTNEAWQSFVSAPAAKSYHGNKLGGLFLHTVGVLRNVEAMLANPSYAAAVGAVVNADRLRFLAMFHDYGKQFDYVWHTGIAWNPDTLLDHRYSGITAFERICDELHIDMPYAERQIVARAIACHHGEYGGDVKPKSVEEWWLHLADMIDGKFVTAADALDAAGTAQQTEDGG